MNPPDNRQLSASTPTRDVDLLGAAEALRRSACKAQALAVQTGTPCYIWRDGQVVNIGGPAGVGGRPDRV
jgi:hypothetical protein